MLKIVRLKPFFDRKSTCDRWNHTQKMRNSANAKRMNGEWATKNKRPKIQQKFNYHRTVWNFIESKERIVSRYAVQKCWLWQMDNLSIGNTSIAVTIVHTYTHTHNAQICRVFFYTQSTEQNRTEPKRINSRRTKVRRQCSSFCKTSRSLPFFSADFNVQIFTFDLVLCLWQYIYVVAFGLKHCFVLAWAVYVQCIHTQNTYVSYTSQSLSLSLFIRRRNSEAIKSAMQQCNVLLSVCVHLFGTFKHSNLHIILETNRWCRIELYGIWTVHSRFYTAIALNSIANEKCLINCAASKWWQNGEKASWFYAMH